MAALISPPRGRTCAAIHRPQCRNPELGPESRWRYPQQVEIGYRLHGNSARAALIFRSSLWPVVSTVFMLATPAALGLHNYFLASLSRWIRSRYQFCWLTITNYLFSAYRSSHRGLTVYPARKKKKKKPQTPLYENKQLGRRAQQQITRKFFIPNTRKPTGHPPLYLR